MSRNRLENMDEERQKRLFESATEEFAEKGYNAASLNRILEKSGMSKSSLYYYFDDKADLFTTIMEKSLAILLKKLGHFDPENMTADTFWTEFEQRYHKAILFVDNSNSWLMKFGGMFYELRSDPKKGAATGRLFQAARNWVNIIITRGQTLGVIRTDLPQSLLIDLVMGLLESLDRWVVVNWNQLTEQDKMDMPEVHVGLFKQMLMP